MKGKEVALKKLFYALRPAAALRWLRLHPDAAIAPMHFPTLLEEGDLPAELAEFVATLLAQKAVTREMGQGPLPPLIREFIDAEFAAAEIFSRRRLRPSVEAIEAAEALFQRFLR